MPEITFLIFCFFFLLFFHNFLARVEYERNLGLNFFFSLCQPPSTRFWIFLLIFWNFLGRVGLEQNSGQNFFFSFSAYLILFWLKIMPERGVLIFWIFLQFFSEFPCPARVGTEFGTKIVFSISLPISSRFG